MKIIKKNQAKSFQNSDACTAYEYSIGDKDINVAVIELNGRYPDSGRVVNEICKEIVHVIEGSGKVVIEEEEVVLETDDQILIEPNERYYFVGNMTFVAPCAPAWYSDQHKEVE